MLHLKHSDVVREMRPYQRRLAPLIIEDVLSGNPPETVVQAVERYMPKVGPSLLFDTQRGWSGDIREAAIYTLLHNGFKKGKAVRIVDEVCCDWSTDETELLVAAEVEIEFGGNFSRSTRAKDIFENAKVIGSGSRCVYVYTDSRLDQHGDTCTKIGRHDRSGLGEVTGRILSQYGTGNPGYPVLRYIFRTEHEVKLEGFLHHKFKDCRAVEGLGTEWFEVRPDDVEAAVENQLDGYDANLNMQESP